MTAKSATQPNWAIAVIVLLAIGLSACHPSQSGSTAGTTSDASAGNPLPPVDPPDDEDDDDEETPPTPPEPVAVCPSADAPNPDQAMQDALLVAFFDAREGDVIEICAGTWNFTTGLILHGKRGVTIRGAGRDTSEPAVLDQDGDPTEGWRTVLNFDNSGASEGINVSHSDGVTIEGLKVIDSPGNAIRVFKSRQVTIRNVWAGWSDFDPATPGYQPDATNGAYALYPVECEHVLIEDSVAVGSSDAGVYVGQSNDIIVRRSWAKYNVAGYEFENTYRAEFVDNIATKNTGGFLVFDLPGLRQYGEKNLVHRNKSYDNNVPNFAPIGNIVGEVPKGTGMLVLSSDQLEIFDNEIYDNDTMGIAVVNFQLVNKNEKDFKFDFFPEGVEIRDNIFRDNGGDPQQPDQERGDGSFLPFIIAAKNNGRSAHIVWDGGFDGRPPDPSPTASNAGPDTDCAMPLDADGIPLDQPNPNETGRLEPRLDERGRPNYSRNDDVARRISNPDQPCRYNAWKFNPGEDVPARPANYLCLSGNQFENTTPQTQGVAEFLNANFFDASSEDVIAQQLLIPASTDKAPHACDLPARLPPTLDLPFVPDPDSADARPTDEEVAAACEAPMADGEINWDALLNYNCPQLAHYNLFADPADPTGASHGRSLPFELNTILFSDYASKDRYVFLPPGANARYQSRATTGSFRETFDFPVGTVLVKSFSFKHEGNGTEDIVETRLLIKRQKSSGVEWVGLPYVWTGEAGSRTAELKLAGSESAHDYDYADPDPEVSARYTGSVARYQVPAALNCITCHGGDDREAGAAPLGLKARYLNRDLDYGGSIGVVNQIQQWGIAGLLDNVPANIASIERTPRWNVPGDSGQTADSAADKHARVRAYLEVNCMHCHNGNGAGSNSGLNLDAYRDVDVRYGVCKKPIAAGSGSGGFQFDIVPGDAVESILHFRLRSAKAGERMPPLARTVVHGEAVDLLTDWVDNVLLALDAADEESVKGESACTDNPEDNGTPAP